LNQFGNVIVDGVAASDLEACMTLQEQPAADRARLSLEAASFDGEVSQRFNAALRRLDEVMVAQNLSANAQLEVDAEGYELPVIRGSGERIQSVQNIVIEIHDPTLPHYVELVSILRECGFALKTMSGEIWGSP